jgi:pimeloyl-ACP methyl ester carboxylesterase
MPSPRIHRFGLPVGLVWAHSGLRDLPVPQAWLRRTQPELLVLWGRHDPSFDGGEPARYRKDVPKAEVHVLDAGHFALDTRADEMAAFIRAFLETLK